ncbi:MAG: AAA family ATPase [Campylobacter sp.]|nr:AAA family ATPase [Campylobacter sp.]
MKKSENIVLVGFMGVGKGTIARALSKEIGYFALDCDDMIESAKNKKIREIFEEEGEESFRQIEKKLAKFLQNNIKGAIISTGGGFYSTPNIKQIGKIIYLRSNFDAIYDRLIKSPNSDKKIAKRPLLQDLNRAKALHDKRDPQYQKIADIIIDVTDKSPKEIVQKIKKSLKESKKGEK